jgi:FkbM family methyltransferase
MRRWVFEKVANLVRRSRFEIGLRELRRDVVFSRLIAQHIRDDERMKAIYAYVIQRDFNCLDIGAHRGEFLRVFQQLAPKGRHIAVEPLPHLAKELRENFPGVDIREVALSDESGTVDFNYVPEWEGWSGLRESKYPTNAVVQKLKVSVTTLDEMLPSDYVPNLIKIDVEGAEIQTFKGAIRTLERHRPFLVFEHFVDAYTSFGAKPEELWDFLVTKLDYRIFSVMGRGPLPREEFARLSNERKCWNYVAHV